jgi:hypothetical protein
LVATAVVLATAGFSLDVAPTFALVETAGSFAGALAGAALVVFDASGAALAATVRSFAAGATGLLSDLAGAEAFATDFFATSRVEDLEAAGFAVTALVAGALVAGVFAAVSLAAVSFAAGTLVGFAALLTGFAVLVCAFAALAVFAGRLGTESPDLLPERDGLSAALVLLPDLAAPDDCVRVDLAIGPFWEVFFAV